MLITREPDNLMCHVRPRQDARPADGFPPVERAEPRVVDGRNATGEWGREAWCSVVAGSYEIGRNALANGRDVLYFYLHTSCERVPSGTGVEPKSTRRRALRVHVCEHVLMQCSPYRSQTAVFRTDTCVGTTSPPYAPHPFPWHSSKPSTDARPRSRCALRAPDNIMHYNGWRRVAHSIIIIPKLIFTCSLCKLQVKRCVVVRRGASCTTHQYTVPSLNFKSTRSVFYKPATMRYCVTRSRAVSLALVGTFSKIRRLKFVNISIGSDSFDIAL